MDTELLSRSLRDAASTVDVRPGFPDAVLRGARRRRARRRVLLVSATAAVTTIVSVGATTLWPDAHPWSTTTAAATDHRLTQPTRGDLADDQDFLSAAVRAWEEGLSRSWNRDRGVFDDRRGAPHVYWAGETPAGRTAVILQRAFLHPHDNLAPSDANRETTLVGLVGVDPVDGRLKLLGDDFPSKGRDTAGFQFGPEDRTVLVLDRGAPLSVSGNPRFETNRSVRDWQPMRSEGGVQIAELPRGTRAATVAVDAKPEANGESFDTRVPLLRSGSYLGREPRTQARDNSLGWQRSGALWLGDPRTGRSTAQVMEDFEKALRQARAYDPYPSQQSVPRWLIVAGVDNRTFLIGEHQAGDEPSQLYVVTQDLDGKVEGVHHLGPTDRGADLPVRVPLPDGRGWIIARLDARLSYSTDEQQWALLGRDAGIVLDRSQRIVVEVQPTNETPRLASLNR
ncbi:hypothetical protein [Streptoalloteichus hindustanus]|uniref:Uncharacterized protein n=1 Tax=Streptoalloteichus hindustanus TaxID=2017 RepID=A0A1M5GBY0_STRHI|nr:hypothetical protein [Streptoalloteichus hindustanus]SHG00991.1 hypothetical protein SAMN05444320_10648 [Streptoalloteichus hindustanus]